jgi:hypothetical protein
MEAAEPRTRKEVWGSCAECLHTWVIYAPLPAPVAVVANAMKHAQCPVCAPAKPRIFMAREADIVAAFAKALA